MTKSHQAYPPRVKETGRTLYGMIILLCLTLLIAGSSAALGAGGAGSTLSVRAYIDGISDLYIRGNNVWWHQLADSAPGREGGVTYPTTLNDVDWYPAWPDVSTPENRSCNCDSSRYEQLFPPLASTAAIVGVTLLAPLNRGTATVTQQPTAANGYTAIIRFNDDYPNTGPYWYEVEISYRGEYFVDIVHGSDSNDGKSLKNPWKTLHYAIAQVPHDNILNVMPGVYRIANGEEDAALSVITDNVHIIGRCRPLIMGNGGSAVNWKFGIIVDANGVTIEGLELTGFDAGIVGEDRSPTIQRNFIHHMLDFGTGAGSGIAFRSTTTAISPNIFNNVIYFCQYDAISISDIRTTSSEPGVPLIYHNTLDGGEYALTHDNIGISIEVDAALSSPVSPIIKYNIISNFSHAPNGIGIENAGGAPTIDSNCFYNNNTDCSGCSKGSLDIVADPQYASAGDEDYDLKFVSPCIDAIPAASGDPVTLDIDDKNRPIDINGITHGGVYDMGAYEKDDDTDHDGLLYSQEIALGTDPEDAYSDADIYHDGEEVAKGSDPKSNASVPSYASGDYYVDASSGSIGLGTQASPWQTLHHAVNVINNATGPGVYTLHLAAGEYRISDCIHGIEPNQELNITRSNVSIIGAGKDLTIINGDGGGFTTGEWMTGFNIQGATAVTLKDMDIRNFNMDGVRTNGSNSVIEACSIHDNGNVGGGNGVYIYGATATNARVYNNYIHSTGNSDHVQNVGVLISSAGLVSQIEVEQNRIENHGAYGIQIQNSGARIYRNKLYNNAIGMHVSASGGGGKTSPAIWNNLIFTVGETSSMQYGIYFTVNGGGSILDTTTVYNNTIDGPYADGIYLNTSGGTASPSIFYNIITTGSGGYGINNQSCNPVVGYNDVNGFGSAYFGCSDTGGGKLVDPAYVSAGSDYHLSAGSPCIDVISSSPVCGDVDHPSSSPCWRPQPMGGSWDMGCYEKPSFVDTDLDGMDDSWETSFFGNLSHDGTADTDGDDLTDLDEYLNNVAPNNTDSDGDDYTDGEEVQYGSLPNDDASIPTFTPGAYYVDADYSNIGLGTQAEPWQSLHRAIDRINNGTAGTYTLYVDQGLYRLVPSGHEEDVQLYVTQSDLTIVGDGAGQTILDGAGGTTGDVNSWYDALDVQAATNVTIYNIEIRNFAANGIHLGSAQGCIIDACSIHDNFNNGINMEYGSGDPPARSSNNIVRNGCAICNNGFAGIYIDSGQNNEIINNTGSIYNNGYASFGEGAGIYCVGCDGLNISGNSIYWNLNTNFPQPAGIYLENCHLTSTGPFQVVGNQIYNHYYSGTGYGIHIVDSQPYVMRNTLYDNSYGVSVTSNPADLDGPPDIWNNLIYNGPSNGAYYGIWIRMDGSKNWTPTMYHNTIDGMQQDAVFIYSSPTGVGGPLIQFNNLTRFVHAGVLRDPSADSGPLDIIRYNNVWSQVAGSTGYVNCSAGTAAISSDPQYVIVASGYNYHLQPTSPCIDTIPQTGVEWPDAAIEDLDGASRPQPAGGSFDMGCYEYQAATHIVTFTAGSGGSLNGETSQTVAYGADCTPVRAVPYTGYHFVGWTGNYTGGANPLTITNVTLNMTVVATFVINQYSVTFIAEAGGSISGAASQNVFYGGDCSDVTAVPSIGYEFIGWTGGYTGTANPLTITNVTSVMTVYANFRQQQAVTHTVTFTSGAGGTLSGNPTQTISDGGNCSAVLAVPDTGYEFTGWTGDYTGTINPLTIINVTADKSIMANFKKKTYNVDTSSGTGGGVEGAPTEPVPYGGAGTLTAVPEEGYDFTGWTGDYTGTENPLVLTNVMSNLNIVAHFNLRTYTVNFTVGPGGSIRGNSSQAVTHGQSSVAVTATPEAGYGFAGWTGDYTGMENPLTLTSVVSNMTVLANFEETTENSPPRKPTLVGPADNAIIPPGPVEFQSGVYVDPEGDAHAMTWWQVNRKDGSDLLINEKSATDLTSYLVSTGFEPGLKYTWQAAYEDEGSGKYSPWSDRREFLVGQSEIDQNVPPVDPGVSFKDYRMISFVQWPEDPSAEAVFGPLMGGGYDQREFKIGFYDPTLGPGGYREYPYFNVEPGSSYWFLAREGLDLTLSGVPVSKSMDICIKLKFNTGNGNGWNMIAPPNDANYHWGDLQVEEKDGSGNIVSGPMPISQLTADNEFIDIRIWSWSDGSYSSTSDPDFLLMKYSGYWVRAKKASVYLCFPAQSQLAMSRSEMKIATWVQGICAQFMMMIDGLGAAYANISTDTPPMPMADFNGKTSGGGSCFISIISEND